MAQASRLLLLAYSSSDTSLLRTDVPVGMLVYAYYFCHPTLLLARLFKGIDASTYVMYAVSNIVLTLLKQK